MKPRHQNPRLLAARLSLPFATALVALFNLTTQSASAVDLFWDGNGNTAGAGVTPTGTWGTDPFWSTSSLGTSATTNATTNRVDDLFFSAGADAINPFTVTVDGSQNARLLTFQEGAATVSGGTITLAGGVGGITLGTGVASGGVTVSTALTLNGNNTFNNTSIRTLTLDTGAFDRSTNRATLNFQGTGTVTSTKTNLSANVNDIVGPWASFGTTTATTYAKFNGSTIAGLGYTGTTDGVLAAASTDVVTGVGNLNYTLGAAGTLGASANINTLRYTGGAGALATDTSFTTLGIMNSGTGLLTFSNAVTSGASATEMVVNTASSDITFGGIFTGTITKTGSGTMTLGNVANSIGGITVNQGVLITNHSGTDQLPSATINSGGTLRWGAGGKFANNALFTINTGGTLDLVGNSDTIGGLTGSGSISSGSGTFNLTLAGTGVAQTYSGTISGTGTLVVNNGADQTLTGSNSFTRGLAINGGATLRVNSVSNTGSQSAIGQGSGSNPGNAPITMGSVGANGTLVYTGTGHSSNRPFQIGVNSSGTPLVTDTGGAIIQADGASNAALTFSGLSGTFNSNRTNATTGVGADRTLTLQGASTGNNTISGIIQNNLATTGTARIGVTKAQAGTWVLSGANTYTGSTSVNAGTLVINGNQSAANGAVSVTGKLTGSGTVGGATTINAAGIHNAGDPTVASGVGSQTFSSTLNYANGSIFEWDLNSNSTASGFDTVVAPSGVSVGTTDTIFKVILGTTAATGIADSGNVFWNTPSGTQTWTMASIFGAAFSGAFQTVQTSTDVSAQGSFTITGTALTWTAVPEPTSALAGILLGAGLLRRRRA